MAVAVEIALKADGQALIVDAPPVLADAAIDTIVASVELSSAWEGLAPTLLCRNCASGGTHSASIAEGAAVVPSAALSAAGTVEIAIVGYDGSRRLTTESKTIKLHESGV